MSWDPLTFGLAWLGYTLLALDVSLRMHGRRHRRLGVMAASVILAHVACIYGFRFEGSIAAAWSKSPPGFLIFNGALCAIVGAPLAAEPWRTRCVLAAFSVVSIGVLGVPFRYPELAVLGGPLFGTFLVAAYAAWRGWKNRS